MTRTPLLFAAVLLFLPGSVFAQVNINFKNNPQLSYHDDTYFLRLPLVDQFEGIPGLYQNVTIEYSPLTQTWRLPKQYGFHIGDPLKDTEIDAVNVIVWGEVPVQVFLEVTGRLDCSAVGEVGIREDGKAFTVSVFHYPPYRGVIDCVYPAPLTAFRKVVPLDVYGLEAGTYTYTVNGKFGGSFTLAAKNVFE